MVFCTTQAGIELDLPDFPLLRIDLCYHTWLKNMLDQLLKKRLNKQLLLLQRTWVLLPEPSYSQPSFTLVPEDPMASSNLVRYQACMWCIYINVDKTLIKYT